MSRYHLKNFLFYLSLLKYSFTNPRKGLQILDAVKQTWRDNENIIELGIKQQNAEDVINILFPQNEYSLKEFSQQLMPLKDHMHNFFDELKDKEYPSTKKPYPVDYSLNDEAGLFLYALCKIIKPLKIVETGVAYGLSSAYILQALNENKKGKLFSIDSTFRPWESKIMIGSVIPTNLRDRWELIFGSSTDKLKDLLISLSSVDIFFHDSLHTSKNMTFEFKTAWPFIKKKWISVIR